MHERTNSAFVFTVCILVHPFMCVIERELTQNVYVRLAVETLGFPRRGVAVSLFQYAGK